MRAGVVCEEARGAGWGWGRLEFAGHNGRPWIRRGQVDRGADADSQ